MEAIKLARPSLDAFERAILPDPEPGRGEIMIRVRSASLNYADYAVATGLVSLPRFPLVPIADAAGEIVAVGPGVDGWSMGERVVLHPKKEWIGGPPNPQTLDIMRGVSCPGALSEYIVAPGNTAVRIPAALSWSQAGTLPVAATTAWNGLALCGIDSGSIVALLGTGGVSIFALQLAKARGARVIITSSSDEKLARARTLGADHLINYRSTPNWDQEVLSLTGGDGADLIIETGGADTFARSVAATKVGGTIFCIGYLSGTNASFNISPIIRRQICIRGNNTGSVVDLAAAVNTIDVHNIQPVVDTQFRLNDIRRAYEYLVSGKHFGKIGIDVSW